MYETPLILARVEDGFVAELTYGADVAWYRNLVATKRGELLVDGAEYQVAGIEDYPAAAGLAAFPPAARTILKLLRRNQFRLIRVQPLTGRSQPLCGAGEVARSWRAVEE